MARPVFIRIRDADGNDVASLIFTEQEGSVKVKYPDGREEIKQLDDLPSSWLTIVAKWNKFGRTL